MRKSNQKPKCNRRSFIVIISIMISGYYNYHNNYNNKDGVFDTTLLSLSSSSLIRHHGNDSTSGNGGVVSFYVNGFIVAVQNRHNSFVPVVTCNNNNNQQVIRNTFQKRNKIVVVLHSAINSKSYDDMSNSKILQQQQQQQQTHANNNDAIVDKNSDNIENNNDNANNNNVNNIITIRLNKVFKDKYSRRKADELIYTGRVSVNGQCITSNDIGRQVIPYNDIISIDNIPFIGWEQRLGYNIYTTSTSTSSSTGSSKLTPQVLTSSVSIATENNSRSITTIQQNQQVTIQKSMLLDDQQDVYIKYWKPIGVTCTTDPTIRGNLLDSLVQYGRYVNSYTTTKDNKSEHDDSNNSKKQYSNNIRTVLNTHRLFSVGRLDKDTSGLLLLTSDGRVPNSVLSKQYNHSKTYYVQVNKPLSDTHIQQLQNGIVITTDRVIGKSISNNNRNRHQSITCTTLPCTIQRVPDSKSNNEVYITIVEGRNRQIRIMFQTIGNYIVQQLHRIQFCNISLYSNNYDNNNINNNLQQPGDWTYLSKNEIQILQNAYNQSINNNNNIV